MTPVVIDASAGVELIADTTRGRALRTLLPVDAVPWVPETFYVEVGSVLRRWDLNAILTPEQIGEALRQLAAWPLHVVQVRSLFADAWRHRKNLTFADATYVALAEHLDAEVLTDDHKLANAPTLAVRMLRLQRSP
ncbi:MAG: type II toxin-antitoxin system VapC family toxin [Actinomycetota bacterium]|nr:type II toxin-antitoxin system VapC family toxin [Actinomycetota bacterium]